MKSRSILITLLATTLGYAAPSSAEVCYDVSGSVTSENITPTIQIGRMDFTLQHDTQVVFKESGSLVGNITSSDATFGTTMLDHKIKFARGDSFRTSGDEAQIIGIVGAEADGAFCAFNMLENITDIPKGTGIFKNVTRVDVLALGTVSNCSYFNENTFTLSGTLCTEQARK